MRQTMLRGTGTMIWLGDETGWMSGEEESVPELFGRHMS